MEAVVFEEIWQSFINGDNISQGSIWGGEGLALIIPLEIPEGLARIAKIQSRLEEKLPFCPSAPEILHITVYLLGNPPEADIPSLSAFLKVSLRAVPAFWVELNRINSFFRAPFLEVDDADSLNSLLASIRPGLIELGYPGMDYGPRGQVWHVTLGAYTQSNDGAAARRLLRELRYEAGGAYPVNELRLVKTSAGLPYRLETLERFPLLGSRDQVVGSSSI